MECKECGSEMERERKSDWDVQLGYPQYYAYRCSKCNLLTFVHWKEEVNDES
ncbi:hypothetical protein LCGC14_1752490 [marine sediment metagenome]|uniref:Zinc finger Ogr/Delta-type domain-containing protein n=1 Tax=marine sediment metagenome TaxID=412755 RepID=A0A0F9H3M2_9ZZZZ